MPDKRTCKGTRCVQQVHNPPMTQPRDNPYSQGSQLPSNTDKKCPDCSEIGARAKNVLPEERQQSKVQAKGSRILYRLKYSIENGPSEKSVHCCFLPLLTSSPRRLNVLAQASVSGLLLDRSTRRQKTALGFQYDNYTRLKHNFRLLNVYCLNANKRKRIKPKKTNL